MWSVCVIVTVTLVSLLPTPTIPTQSEYNARIPFGTRFKTSKISRRQANPASSVTPAVPPLTQTDRFPRGLIYQQPYIVLNPVTGYTYPVPTTEEPRGYIYKKPTTTTTTTTPEPAVEQEQDIDSAFLTPAPPPPSFPEKEFESSPVEVDDTEDKWDIRDSVPGTPGADYPVHSRIPKTSFRCEGRIPGFYGDPQTQCQVYHRCSDCADNVRLQMDSFLCPNGTQFNQEVLACDWWGNVHCENTRNFYKLNEELNQLGPDGKYLQLSGTRQAPPLLQKKVAPAIIPKSERRPLPAIYRSQHRGDHYDHGDSDGHSSQSSQPSQPQPKDPIIFNEFRKPVTQQPPNTRLGNKNPIQSALDNPDYFDPDVGQDQGQDPRKVPTMSSEISDEDYFNTNEQVEVRSSIDYAEKLDNDALRFRPAASSNQMSSMRDRARTTTKFPQVPSSSTSSLPTTPSTLRTTYRTTKPTTVRTTTSVRTTQPRTTQPQTTLPETTLPVTTFTTPKPEPEEENEIQPLVGLRRREESEDDASGFIVNQSNKNKNRGDDTTGLTPPARVTVSDSYLTPTERPFSSTYIPPLGSKPKLDYLPPSTEVKPEYGAPRDSYLPPVVGPKQALPAPHGPQLQIYQGNPYVQAPLPQAIVQPSTFNYIPFSGGYFPHQYQQPHFKIVTSHVPTLNLAQFSSSAAAPAQTISPYFSGTGFGGLNTLGSTNIFAQPQRYVQG